jgi:uncharacterized membrane protein
MSQPWPPLTLVLPSVLATLLMFSVHSLFTTQVSVSITPWFATLIPFSVSLTPLVPVPFSVPFSVAFSVAFTVAFSVTFSISLPVPFSVPIPVSGRHGYRP